MQKRDLLDTEFTDSCWQKIYKKYEPDFKQAFIGSMGSKESFKAKLLQQYSDTKFEVLEIGELKIQAKTIFGETPLKITPIENVDFARILEIENDAIWNKKIVGTADVDIANLIQKLNHNDWVNQGRGYIQKDRETCPFCQQETLNVDLKKQFEDFFDDTYLNDIKRIENLKLEYNSLTQNIINQLNTIEIDQKTFKDSKLNIESFSNYLKTVLTQNAINNELLNNKLKEPSRSIEIISLKEELDLITSLITQANSEIKKHNDIVANFNTEKDLLIQSIWKFIIEESRTEITKFNSDKLGLEKGIAALKTQLDIIINQYNVSEIQFMLFK